MCCLCVQEVLSKSELNRKCHTCDELIQHDYTQDDFKVNYKLLSLLVNPGNMNNGKNSLQTELLNTIACPRHPDRPIAYFCKGCNVAVCVDCLFD